MALPNTNTNYVILDPFDTTSGDLDTSGLYICGDGYVATSTDGGQNWTNLTSGMGTPPNAFGDSPAPAATDLDYTFIAANPFSDNEIFIQANWTNGNGDYRAFVVKRDNALTWTWFTPTIDDVDPSTLTWLVDLDPADDYTSAGSDVTTLTNSGTGGNASAGTSPGAAPSFIADIGNSKRGVTYDASNFEYVTFGSSLGRPANCTIFVAVNFLTLEAGGDYIAAANDNVGTDSTAWGSVVNNGGAKIVYTFGDDTNVSSGETEDSISSNTLMVIALRYTAGDTAYDIWDNGVALTIETVNSSAATSQTGTTYDYAIGRRGEYHAANRYADAEVGRFYISTSVLTDTQVVGISRNLCSYYNISTVGGNTMALSLDIDRHTGTYMYTCQFDSVNILLQQHNISNLAVAQTKTLGTATVSEITARTYYAQAFTPPSTFGDNSTVYVYGRWDDGSVRHIQKSTDGGATLTDISPSGSEDFGADWCSAFFATDANNLYAFRAGASPGLYRTNDGGTTWSLLSTMTFDVERASLGGDGRLVVVSRETGAVQVEVADSPLFSTWTDITGTLGATGKGSVIWV